MGLGDSSSAHGKVRGRSAERGSHSGRRVSRTPSAPRVSSAGVREEININLHSGTEVALCNIRGVAQSVGTLLDTVRDDLLGGLRDDGLALWAGGSQTVTEVLPLIQPGWRISLKVSF